MQSTSTRFGSVTLCVPLREQRATPWIAGRVPHSVHGKSAARWTLLFTSALNSGLNDFSYHHSLAPCWREIFFVRAGVSATPRETLTLMRGAAAGAPRAPARGAALLIEVSLSLSYYRAYTLRLGCRVHNTRKVHTTLGIDSH